VDNGLTMLEQRYVWSTKAYSATFSLCWLAFIQLTQCAWPYVLILRGFMVMATGYLISLLDEGSYIDPPSNREWGTVCISALLSNLV